MSTDGLILEYIMGGGILAIATFSIATFKQVAKIKDEVDKKIGRDRDEIEKKINRSFERLDEIKVKSEEKFVFKDVCRILHEQTARDIIEIKADLKLLLRKNGIDD